MSDQAKAHRQHSHSKSAGSAAVEPLAIERRRARDVPTPTGHKQKVRSGATSVETREKYLLFEVKGWRNQMIERSLDLDTFGGLSVID